MSDPILDSLVQRVTDLENRLAASKGQFTAKDWRSVVGMFDDSEVMLQVIEEGRKIREGG